MSPAAAPRRGRHKGASRHWLPQRNERARWCQQHLQERCNRDHSAHVDVGTPPYSVVAPMSSWALGLRFKDTVLP